MSVMQEFQALVAELEAARAAVQAKAKVAFGVGAKALFEAHPTMETFSWRQYTPYFNDGDACTFSAHVDDPYINGVDSYGYTEDDDEEGLDPKPSKAMFEAVAEFLRQFPEELFEPMFGDHVSVTAYRDGRVEADDYSHA